MSAQYPIEAFVLAGGKSSRMGQDKGLVVCNGKPMIQHVTDAVSQIGVPISIVANGSQYNRLGYRVVADKIPDKGPLGGLYTALSECTTDAVLLLSCDTPYITVEVLDHLMSQYIGQPAVVIRTQGALHPLCSVYSRTALDTVTNHIEKGALAMHELISNIGCTVVDMDSFATTYPNAFTNINTMSELKDSLV